MSVVLSFGKYGGFYTHSGASLRLCLGWFAITLFRGDFDEILWDALDCLEQG